MIFKDKVSKIKDELAKSNCNSFVHYFTIWQILQKPPDGDCYPTFHLPCSIYMQEPYPMKVKKRGLLLHKCIQYLKCHVFKATSLYTFIIHHSSYIHHITDTYLLFSIRFQGYKQLLQDHLLNDFFIRMMALWRHFHRATKEKKNKHTSHPAIHYRQMRELSQGKKSFSACASSRGCGPVFQQGQL